EDEADRRADTRQCHRLDEELPENRRSCRAERFAHADFLRTLRDRDHHDRDDPDAADEQTDRRQREADDEERPEEWVVVVEETIVCDDREVVYLRRAQATLRPEVRGDIIDSLL